MTVRLKPVKKHLLRPKDPTVKTTLTRPPMLREEHMVIEAKLYCEGLTQAKIADRIGLAPQTVSKDLQEIRSRWLQAMLQSFSEMKARELAKIDNLEREYWDAWRHSVEVRKKRKAVVVAGSRARTEQVTEEEDATGDPRFLAGVMNCIEKRIALLGLQEPKEQRILVGHVSVEQEAPAFDPESKRREMVAFIEQAGLAQALIGDGLKHGRLEKVVDADVVDVEPAEHE